MPGLRHAHTLQQLEWNNDSFFRDYYFLLMLFLLVLLFLCLFFVFLLLILLNTLPGVSTQRILFSCCSVWAWRKPGIKKSWVLELLLLLSSSSSTIVCHVHSSSLPSIIINSKVFKTRSPFCDRIRDKKFKLRNRINLHLGIKILVAALHIFIFPPDYFYLLFIYYFYFSKISRTQFWHVKIQTPDQILVEKLHRKIKMFSLDIYIYIHTHTQI